jgi:exodeoxyribonuclease V alpha subunit
MIRQNDYRQELYNGDIGIVWGCDGEIFVVFENHPGGFELNKLPDHELVFAMSVHKSQGSGFDDVLFVMPPEAGELMNREMVYTAMTRAKKHLCSVGTPEVLADALARRTSRMSNLTGRLICDWSESLF